MKMEYECKLCMVNALDRLIRKNHTEVRNKNTLMNNVLYYLSEVNSTKKAPEVAHEVGLMAKRFFQNPDPYKESKRMSNDLILKEYHVLEKILEYSKDPIGDAMRLSIGGNVIDLAANPDFFVNESGYLMRTMDKVLLEQFEIDDSEELKDEISKAKSILILGDNCGEIVLDKLFIETIDHPQVYYAVRGDSVLNDATMEDAAYVGLTSIAKVISNGDDTPSTLLDRTSPEFRRIYEKADLVISKGQGNLEGLLDSKRENLFFLLMVKCDVIARKLGVKKGGGVVMKNGKQRQTAINYQKDGQK